MNPLPSQRQFKITLCSSHFSKKNQTLPKQKRTKKVTLSVFKWMCRWSFLKFPLPTFTWEK